MDVKWNGLAGGVFGCRDKSRNSFRRNLNYRCVRRLRIRVRGCFGSVVWVLLLRTQIYNTNLLEFPFASCLHFAFNSNLQKATDWISDNHTEREREHIQWRPKKQKKHSHWLEADVATICITPSELAMALTVVRFVRFFFISSFFFLFLYSAAGSLICYLSSRTFQHWRYFSVKLVHFHFRSLLFECRHLL